MEQESMSRISSRAERLRRLGLLTAALAAPPLASAFAAPDASGRYAVLRDDRDTGCMLTLDSRARGPGGFRAQLAPACRDNGIVIFDPVGWALDRGRLVLTARKGHKAHFERDDAGVWRRDPKEGKSLGFKPL
jgi:Protease inhibitor Inh